MTEVSDQRSAIKNQRVKINRPDAECLALFLPPYLSLW